MDKKIILSTQDTKIGRAMHRWSSQPTRREYFEKHGTLEGFDDEQAAYFKKIIKENEKDNG